MNLRENLLQTLEEEASEVIKECSKANRFGLMDINPKTGITNKHALQDEINDFFAVVVMLVEEGFLDEDFLTEENQQGKIQKVQKYLKYSREQGTLTL